MKLTDLMIGDWVQFTYKPYEQNEPRTIVFQLSEIENFSAAGLYFACGVGYGRVCKVEDLQPVDLTPEILIRNGFEWKYKQAYQINNTEGWGVLYISYWKGRLSIRVSNDIREKHSTNEIHLSCSYVHELQNALRLCGIDKEIEL